MQQEYIQLIERIIYSKWFIAIEYIGTFSYSLSGLLLALKYNANWLGTVILCFLPCFGGGVVRDLICGRFPTVCMASNEHFILMLLIATIGFVLMKSLKFFGLKNEKFRTDKSNGFFEGLLMSADALGMASISIFSIFIAIFMKCDPIYLWGPFFAFIGSVGGTIMRNIFLGNKIDVNKIVGEFYGEVCIFWSTLFSFLWYFFCKSPYIFIIVNLCLIFCFLTRIVIHFYIKYKNEKIQVV